MAADAVKCLLDREDTRILRCLAHEIYDRIKAHIWMMQEDISLADHLKDILVILELRHRCRCMFRALVLVKAFQSIKFHQHGKIQRSIDAVNICFLDLKFFLEDIKKTCIHLFFCLKSDDLAPLAFLELFLDLYQKILCLIFVDREVRITHDTVRMRADNIIAQEKLADIALNDLFQKDHGTVAFFCGRDLYDPWKYRRHLNGGKFQLFGMFFVIFLGDQCADIQSLIADEWKWSGRIHGHRSQYRIHIVLEIPVNKFLLFLVQILMLCNQVKSHFLKCRKDRTVEGAILYFYQLMCLFADLTELFFGGHSCDVFFLVTCMHLILEGCDTHHKKLIQV